MEWGAQPGRLCGGQGHGIWERGHGPAGSHGTATPRCLTVLREGPPPVLAGSQREKILPGMLAQGVCGKGTGVGTPWVTGIPGQGARDPGGSGVLTVEGGEGDGRLAAEVIIFQVGIRILGNGCDQRVWGVTRGCGICHQPGAPAPQPPRGPARPT